MKRTNKRARALVIVALAGGLGGCADHLEAHRVRERERLIRELDQPIGRSFPHQRLGDRDPVVDRVVQQHPQRLARVRRATTV